MNKRLLCFLLFRLVLVVADMDEFEATVLEFLKSHPDWFLNLSGVAEVHSINDTLEYSASFIPPSNSAFQSPRNYLAKFQANKLPGYSFSRMSSLKFQSNLSLPKPNWRLQVVYKKLG